MAPKPQESGLYLLRELLDLSSPLQPESSKNRIPIFISIPKPSKETPELPFKITILDLLDLSHLPPHQIPSTHTFTTKVPLCWTQSTTSPSPNKMKLIFVTKNIVSLAQLLPPKRELYFVSSGIEPNMTDVVTVLKSLGLNSKMNIAGIFDIEMLAKEVASLGGCRDFPKTLQRLGCSMDSLENCPEVVLRAMLLLVVEGCKMDFMDGNGRAWLDCIRAVGIGSSTTSLIGTVKKGADKVGMEILGRAMRSKEEIERIRAERRARRQEVEVEEEYVTEIRLWDGMWELL